MTLERCVPSTTSFGTGGHQWAARPAFRHGCNLAALSCRDFSCTVHPSMKTARRHRLHFQASKSLHSACSSTKQDHERVSW